MTQPVDPSAPEDADRSSPGAAANVYPRDSAEFGRALAFVDAIFGFSITLLIASVDPPSGDAWKSVRTLFDTDLGNQLTAFAISFVVIAAFWRSNHRTIAGFDALDPLTLRVCIVLVGLVVFIPFTTRALGVSDFPLATALYALNITLVVLTNAALTVLGRIRGLASYPDGQLRSDIAGALATAVVFLASIPVAYLVSPTAAMWSWLSLAVINPLVDRFAAAGKFAE